jgi:diaminopimelate decarboxylase
MRNDPAIGAAARYGADAMTRLAERFGTPLIVIDRTVVAEQARAYTDGLGADRAYFGAKALPCIALMQLARGLGLGVDVSTGGELGTALAAGVRPEHLLLHGNNKSDEELRLARDSGVGRIVVDSFDEIDRLARIGPRARLLLRVTPGVDSDTHRFIATGHDDSKFGFAINGGSALEALRRLSALPELDVVGLHSHLGSQLTDLDAYGAAADRLAELAATAREELSLTVSELDVGGGLGIPYRVGDAALDLRAAVPAIRAAAEAAFARRGLPVPRILMEPGRSIVGPAGFTLYRVGTIKRTPSRVVVAVDGGMSDNIRPALYGAKHEAFAVRDGAGDAGLVCTLVGKHCESGDVLVEDVALSADVRVGDLVCVPVTGAYTYAMASNYNRVPRPAVVLSDGEDAVTIVERETESDVRRLDRALPGEWLSST